MTETEMERRPGRWRSWLHQVGVVVRAAARRIKDGWSSHRRRATTDPEYVSALAAVILAAVELITDDIRVHGVVHALATAYVAIHRALSPDRWEQGFVWS